MAPVVPPHLDRPGGKSRSRSFSQGRDPRAVSRVPILGAQITVASPGSATERGERPPDRSPPDSPVHSLPALPSHFHRPGTLWGPLWQVLVRFIVVGVGEL